MHEGVLMGLLVTSREDRAWNEQERNEIERVAQTLTFARLMDRRREWVEQQLSQQRRLQAQQRDLLDNLLHQFRNPLTALRTFGKLLLKRLVPGDANRAVADNILRESDRLNELLQQFDRAIDLSVEDLEPIKSLPPASPVMEATVEPLTPPLPLLLKAEGSISLCAVADVLKPLLASAIAIAQERNLDLQADIPANLPQVRANPKELREVLSNLIDNALKYTPAGGKIYIQAGLEQDRMQGIAISDTGMGIPPQDLEHMFERHYRGEKADSEIPGTGLGLAIAKELIEQMQGKIQVFSPAQWHPDSNIGAGTTVIIWLKMMNYE
jgi:signal transduction histidine kinase